MKQWSPQRLLATIAISALLWAAVAFLCLFFGSTGSGWSSMQSWLPERLPRVLQASLIGAALASAGVVYQAILRNPLAEPYLLGVSSGASLASYLWQLPAFATVLAAMGPLANSFSQQACSFLGALLAIAIVFLLSTRRGRLEPTTLVLVGVILNIIIGAIFLLIDAIIKAPAGGSLLNFLVGGIQTNVRHYELLIAACVFAVSWLALVYLSGVLNAASLSDADALALGVRIHRLRWIALIIASLITASAVAVSGPIGFVGLICPHLSRLIVGNDQRKLLPIATATGAAALALADAISRYLLSEPTVATQLPVGVITGLLGGPFFLLILFQSRQRLARREGAVVV